MINYIKNPKENAKKWGILEKNQGFYLHKCTQLDKNYIWRMR